MATNWNVEYARSVEQDIERLPARIREKFFSALARVINSLTSGKKLEGYKNAYSVRFAGSYRIGYLVHKQSRTISIEYVGPRGGAYRWLRSL